MAVKYQIIVHFLFVVNIPTPILRWNTTGITVTGSETGIPGNDSYYLQAPWGLALGDNNTLYIADSNNQQVQTYLPGVSFGLIIASYDWNTLSKFTMFKLS